MEENKERDVQTERISVEKRSRAVIRDVLAGACIGVAFIIPGFSGGSVAAILGIYEKLINAIANIFKEMKKSILTLLPIGIGLVLGAMALIFPLELMLERFPLPTASIFVGLAIGGLPSVFAKLEGGLRKMEIYPLTVALVLAALLSFVPVGADVDLLNIGFGGYVLLFLVGILGSSALVVPGISGSMILLILGYYNPIVSLVTDHLMRLQDLGRCVLVLGSCGMGIAAGFLIISIIMKHLLAKHPRSTYAAIIGFIIGSLPAVYVSTMKSAGMLTPSLEISHLPASPVHYAVCLFLLIMGACASYNFASIVGKRGNTLDGH
jgi:putative membrane protein